jgi:hypothetical protein
MWTGQRDFAPLRSHAHVLAVLLQAIQQARTRTNFVAEREMLRRQRLHQLAWNYRAPADHELIGDALNHAVRIGSLDGA